MNMIEKVARAIENEVDKLASVENIGGFYDVIARAAITALRDPTEDQIKYLKHELATTNTEICKIFYQGLIEEALKE